MLFFLDTAPPSPALLHLSVPKLPDHPPWVYESRPTYGLDTQVHIGQPVMHAPLADAVPPATPRSMWRGRS